MNVPVLKLSKGAYDIGITNPVIAIVENVTAASSLGTPLENEIRAVTTEAQRIIEASRARAEYEGFKGLFGRLGYDGQATAFDRLAYACLTKGFKPINAIVDAYNLASLRMGSPVGGHDLAAVGLDVTISRASGGQRLLPLFKDKEKNVPAGDLIYTSNGHAMCWMGRQDLDCHHFRIKGSTSNILLMAIGNERTSLSYNQEICELTYSYLLSVFPAARMKTITHSGELLL